MRPRPAQHGPRPRLGIYEPSPGKSGPSRYVDALLDGIDPNEFDVTLFCCADGPYRSRDGITQIETYSQRPLAVSHPGLAQAPPPKSSARRELRTLVPPSIKLWSGFAREARRLAEIFRAHPVDLLHTNNTGCEESPVAARLAGIPRMLGTFHVDPTYDLTGARSHLRHRALECLSNHCLHAAIAVSEATRQDWIRRTRLPADRVTTIHNGVTPGVQKDRAAARHRLGLPPDRLIIGSVGRLDYAKGFSDLIATTATLAPDHPTLSLALAGDGPLRASLETLAATLGIRNRVHFLGFQQDVSDFYAAIDVFALSSLCETLSYALLDAMAAGLPAVATAVGGVPEVVAPDITGFLVPPRDPEAFATSLRPLLTNPHLRAEMGRAAQHRVAQHFDVRTTVAKTLALYRDLLGLTIPTSHASRAISRAA